MTSLMDRVRGDAFTVTHFREWARDLILDNEEPWHLEPFQEAFIADVFEHRTACWLIVPEGNGKTTLMAGLALYHIQHKLSASCPVAAASREQAKILYDQAAGFVFRSQLDHIFKCQEGYRRILCPSMDSEMQVFAADARTGDGIIPTLGFIDELHRHKNLNLYRTWLGKMRKRGGQLCVISTAGEPGSEFETARDEMRQVEDVVIDGPFIRAVAANAVIHDWALREGSDPEDMEAVAAANPFSGVTVESLAEKRALPGMSPQHWARFTCNLPTRSNTAAIQESEWYNATAAEPIPADATDVWLGMDVGWKWDTTAVVPLWWSHDEYRLLGDATIIEPPRDSSSTHPDVIKRAVLELCSRYRVSTVVMDVSGARDIAVWMEDEAGLTVVDRAQTNKPQSEDYARFMEALRGGKLFHSGDAGLRSHAMNAIARLLPDGGAKFGRTSETRQGGNQEGRVIDALVAAAMVHSYAVESRLEANAWVGWAEEPVAA